ncbi:hypothetical protein [Planktotalea sp.]|uniref:hypothetical protein n=1 Tax=Planktotalea sp. TaxID=2029877 RepID=UPI003D6B3FFA
MTVTKLITVDGLIELETLPASAMTEMSMGNSLAKINRYAGRTSEPWSVASHSVLVASLCPHKEEQAWGLLHDAHEAFIGDLISPAVEFIASQSRPVAGACVESCVSSAKAVLDRQIQRAWQIDPAHVDLEEVAHYDRIALDAEMLVFFNCRRDDWSHDHDRAVELLRGLPITEKWRAGWHAWVCEAERLAQLGACRIPTSKTNLAA